MISNAVHYLYKKDVQIKQLVNVNVSTKSQQNWLNLKVKVFQFVMLHLLHLCMALVQGQLIWPFHFNFFILLTSVTTHAQS